MQATIEIAPLDSEDFELLKKHGLSDDQAEQVVVVCGQVGLSIASIIPLLKPAIVLATEAIEAVPDLGKINAQIDAPTYSREERRHSIQEQRRRPMRKPTGKPRDQRRRR